MKRRLRQREDLYVEFAVWCRNEYYRMQSAAQCCHGNVLLLLLPTSKQEFSFFETSFLLSRNNSEVWEPWKTYVYVSQIINKLYDVFSSAYSTILLTIMLTSIEQRHALQISLYQLFLICVKLCLWRKNKYGGCCKTLSWKEYLHLFSPMLYP
jgi:hypothetical protein